MPTTSNARQQPERSLTWPQPLHIVTKTVTPTPKAEPGSISAAATTKPSHDPFLEDLDANPEDYFLSPIQMYEYEDWAADSDDDEEVEWDAGITDFALFDEDRRRAQDSNEPIPSRWNDMLSQQASALRRAAERTRSYTDLSRSTRLEPSADDVPNLTPDTSPNLRDDLDVESFHSQSAARPQVPNYLTIVVTPPTDIDVEDDDDDDEEDYTENARDEQPQFTMCTRPRSPVKRHLQRPGLRHSRTMSGHVHAWQRPSRNIYILGEDSEAEECAEHCAIRRIDSGIDGASQGRECA